MKRLRTGKVLAGIAALVLLFVLIVAGCDTGTSPKVELPPAEITPPRGPGQPGTPSVGTGTKSNTQEASALTNWLNGQAGGITVAEYNEATATVTVKKYLTVTKAPSAAASFVGPRAAGDSGEEISVSDITIPNGVIFKVDADAGITVAPGGTITVGGGDATYKAAAIDIAAKGEGSKAGAITVQEGGKIEALGSVTVNAGATLTVNNGATVAVKSAGKIVVNTGAEVKVDGTLTLTNTAVVEVKKTGSDNAGKITVSGTLSVQSSAKVDLQGGTLEVAASGAMDNKGTIAAASGSKVHVKAGGNIETSSGGKAELKNATLDVQGTLTATGSNTKVELPAESEVTVVAKEGATVTKGDETVSLSFAGAAVSYGEGNALTVTFTFSKAVTAVATEGSSETWTIAPTTGGTASTTVTATYSGSVAPAKLSLTATDSDSNELILTAADYYPVGSTAFTRSTATYEVVYYGEVGTYTIAGLKNNSNTAYYLVTDDYFKKLFGAIYTPNAPNSVNDSIESGKTTVPYNSDISAAVLPLFQVKLATDQANDVVELTGTPPAANISGGSATNMNPIIIDIGLPGTANSGLPIFKIPLDTAENGSKKGTLGVTNGNYAHVRLRVNNGAELVILADNTNDISSSCPPGGFTNGAVEVMSGGKLRDGAYQGFPLGSGAVIINRSGSYLSIGPENNTEPTSWWYGYLIGPDSDPRIQWSGSAGDFIEVRDGKLAFSGKATVKKTLGLIYSVWFLGNSEITIDIPDTYNNKIYGYNGLFANDGNGSEFNFYGPDKSSTAKIILKNGVLHKAYLSKNVQNDSAIVLQKGSTADAVITSKGQGSGTSEDPTIDGVNYVDGSTPITGYLNWDISDTNLAEGNIPAGG